MAQKVSCSEWSYRWMLLFKYIITTYFLTWTSYDIIYSLLSYCEIEENYAMGWGNQRIHLHKKLDNDTKYLLLWNYESHLWFPYINAKLSYKLFIFVIYSINFRTMYWYKLTSSVTLLFINLESFSALINEHNTCLLSYGKMCLFRKLKICIC